MKPCGLIRKTGGSGSACGHSKHSLGEQVTLLLLVAKTRYDHCWHLELFYLYVNIFNVPVQSGKVYNCKLIHGNAPIIGEDFSGFIEKVGEGISHFKSNGFGWCYKRLGVAC